MRPYSELFWSAFFRIWTECGEIRSISPVFLRIRALFTQRMFLYEDHKEVKSFSYAKIKYILVLADVSIFDNNQLQQLELRTIKKDVGEEKNSF